MNICIEEGNQNLTFLTTYSTKLQIGSHKPHQIVKQFFIPTKTVNKPSFNHNSSKLATPLTTFQVAKASPIITHTAAWRLHVVGRRTVLYIYVRLTARSLHVNVAYSDRSILHIIVHIAHVVLRYSAVRCCVYKPDPVLVLGLGC